MEPTNALDRTGEPAAVGGPLQGASGLLEEVSSLWYEVRGLVHDRLTLAALETRLAGKSLVTMIAAGVMVACLLVSAWLRPEILPSAKPLRQARRKARAQLTKHFSRGL